MCVSVLGPDATFPDFFTRDSGFLAPSCVESPALAAVMMQKKTELSMESGMLIAVPIPEQHQAEGNLIKEAIGKGLIKPLLPIKFCRYHYHFILLYSMI